MSIAEMREGAPRLGRDGSEDGVVTPEDAAVARERYLSWIAGRVRSAKACREIKEDIYAANQHLDVSEEDLRTMIKWLPVTRRAARRKRELKLRPRLVPELASAEERADA